MCVPNSLVFNASLNFSCFKIWNKAWNKQIYFRLLLLILFFYDNTFCGKQMCTENTLQLYYYIVLPSFETESDFLQTQQIRRHKKVLYLRAMFLFHNLVFTLRFKSNCKNIILCIISFIGLFEWTFRWHKKGCKIWCWSFLFWNQR